MVASKFFPATDDMIDSNNGEAPGQLFALCETDYFRRLNLLCAKCGGALRASYITALGELLLFGWVFIWKCAADTRFLARSLAQA